MLSLNRKSSMGKPNQITIQYTDYSSLSELEPEYRALCEKAKAMSEDAYAPYSSFKVGAAVLLADGKMVGGSNQENRAFPSGLCAERVALFSASASFPEQKFEALAVFADTIDQISPCGSCRQVMLEYEEKQAKAIDLFLLNGKGKIRRFSTSSDLLPFGFRFKDFSK